MVKWTEVEGDTLDLSRPPDICDPTWCRLVGLGSQIVERYRSSIGRSVKEDPLSLVYYQDDPQYSTVIKRK